MGYRDEEEALRARLERLEDQVREQSDARQETDRLRERVGDLERQLASARSSKADLPRPMSPPPAPPPFVAPSPPFHVPPPPAPPATFTPRQTVLFALLVGALPLLFSAVMCAALGPVVIPPMGRLAAPLACPSDYDHSEVQTSRVTVNGNASDEWDLVCTLKDGSKTAASGVGRYGGMALFGALFPALALGFVVLRGRLRRKAQSEKA